MHLYTDDHARVQQKPRPTERRWCSAERIVAVSWPMVKIRSKEESMQKVCTAEPPVICILIYRLKLTASSSIIGTRQSEVKRLHIALIHIVCHPWTWLRMRVYTLPLNVHDCTCVFTRQWRRQSQSNRRITHANHPSIPTWKTRRNLPLTGRLQTASGHHPIRLGRRMRHMNTPDAVRAWKRYATRTWIRGIYKK